MERGEAGQGVQWAIRQQIEVGRYFGARRLIPVGSVLASAEIGITGKAGLELIEWLAARGSRARVPTLTAVCSLDFERWTEFQLPAAQYANELRMHKALRSMGFIDSSTCINYQTVTPPRYGEHLAWGDTGAVCFANSATGARSNYEGGPASIAAALSGLVPEYGFHLPQCRRASRVYELTIPLRGTADWSALGAWIGSDAMSYWTVPAVATEHALPTVDELKHFLASAASFGSLAMAHVVGATPEAPALRVAFEGRPIPSPIHVGRAEIESVYARFPRDSGDVDLVVFSAPQLSLQEVLGVLEHLGDRSIANETRLIVTVNHQVKAELDRLGFAERLTRAGGEFLTGTCFYVMNPALVRERFGFRTLLTPSCKLANILGGAGYRPVLASVEACVDAAVRGRLD